MPCVSCSRWLRPQSVPTGGSVLAAGAVVAAQSSHGARDVGMGVWTYDYVPFFAYAHGDFVRGP